MIKKILDASGCIREKWMTQIQKHSDTRQDLWIRVITKCMVWTSMMYSHPLSIDLNSDFALFSCNEGFRVGSNRC
jgi:hypothetical protein